MNGADHYREAERLADAYKLAVDAIEINQPFTTPQQFEDATLGVLLATNILAKAQLHATLALAAATVVERWTSPQHDGSSASYTPIGTGWPEAIS